MPVHIIESFFKMYFKSNISLLSFLASSLIHGLIAVLTPYFSQSGDFGPLKKTTKRPPKFYICSSFGPPRPKKNKKNNTWHLT